MKINKAIKNLRELKDEALQLREGMNYKKAVQIAKFCDNFVFELSEDETLYGSSGDIISISQPLTLKEISTPDKQDALLRNKQFAGNYPDRISIGSEVFLKAKEKISSVLDDEWPSELFTSMEIYSLSVADEDTIVDTVNAALTKDILQSTKIKQMENNEPIVDIMKSFMDFKPWQTDIMSSDYIAWLLEDCKAIEEYCSIYSKYLREDREALEDVVFELKDSDWPITPKDSMKLFSYGCGLQAYFNSESERRDALKELMRGNYGFFVRPIVSFLQTAGMSEKSIVDTFSGMKKMARSLVNSNDKLLR